MLVCEDIPCLKIIEYFCLSDYGFFLLVLSYVDDQKLGVALKKLNLNTIPGIDEVNMFQDDGKIIHFVAPKGMHLFLLYFNYGMKFAIWLELI